MRTGRTQSGAGAALLVSVFLLFASASVQALALTIFPVCAVNADWNTAIIKLGFGSAMDAFRHRWRNDKPRLMDRQCKSCSTRVLYSLSKEVLRNFAKYKALSFENASNSFLSRIPSEARDNAVQTKL